MSDFEEDLIASLPEFLAHALELEVESRDRYREMAACMELHHNPEAAELFNEMARYSELHVREVLLRAEGIELPAIAPWGFKWTCGESPEVRHPEDAHYLMSRRQALELALCQETRARDFYLGVAKQSESAEVRALARDMAGEEQDHVDLLTRWVAGTRADNGALQEDLDPPNVVA
jgi:rubrerythrin